MFKSRLVLDSFFLSNAAAVLRPINVLRPLSHSHDDEDDMTAIHCGATWCNSVLRVGFVKVSPCSEPSKNKIHPYYSKGVPFYEIFPRCQNLEPSKIFTQNTVHCGQPENKLTCLFGNNKCSHIRFQRW